MKKLNLKEDQTNIGKTYTIKLEDKAAFLNRLNKQGIQVTSDDIVDNTLNKTFELTLYDPAQVKIADELLKQSTKIDDNPPNKPAPLNNHPKIQELRNLIRKELKELKR